MYGLAGQLHKSRRVRQIGPISFRLNTWRSDRADPFESEGRRFESCRARQSNQTLTAIQGWCRKRVVPDMVPSFAENSSPRAERSALGTRENSVQYRLAVIRVGETAARPPNVRRGIRCAVGPNRAGRTNHTHRGSEVAERATSCDAMKDLRGITPGPAVRHGRDLPSARREGRRSTDAVGAGHTRKAEVAGSRSHDQEGERVGLPSAGPRGERLLQEQVDHRRPASRAVLRIAGSRGADSLQHPESDDGSGWTCVLPDRRLSVRG